jgi:hypothetical protein
MVPGYGILLDKRRENKKAGNNGFGKHLSFKLIRFFKIKETGK